MFISVWISDVCAAHLYFARMKKDKVYLRRSMYMGTMILSLAKLHAFKFHYDVIKETYGDDARLLKMDTDSLLYHIHTDDIYQDMLDQVELKRWVENSNYTKEFTTLSGNVLLDKSREKDVGLMKNESCDGV